MPTPVSFTVNLMSNLLPLNFFCSMTTAMVPFFSVNLTAFEIKLISTCLILPGSERKSIDEKEGSIHKEKSMSFLEALAA